jgi:hypothetical protein
VIWLLARPRIPSVPKYLRAIRTAPGRLAAAIRTLRHAHTAYKRTKVSQFVARR